MDNTKSKNQNNPIYVEQGKQLKNVINYIIKKHYPHKTISFLIDCINNKYDTDYERTYFSHLQKGSRPIPNKLIKILNKEYNINSDYIYGNSKSMLDTLNMQFDCFCQIAGDWLAVFCKDKPKSIENSFLQIEMDSNLYNFLIAKSNKSLFERGEVLSINDTIIYDEEDIKDMKSINKNYLLIPLENVQKAEEEIQKLLDLRKHLQSSSEITEYLKQHGIDLNDF